MLGEQGEQGSHRHPPKLLFPPAYQFELLNVLARHVPVWSERLHGGTNQPPDEIGAVNP